MTHDDFLDPGTTERLLAGMVAPADAPPGYGPVASVLASAALPGSAPDLDFEELARVARRSVGHPGSPRPRRSPMLGKLLTLKAAAAAGVILIGASGAAAATGSLPGVAQRAAHDTLSHVGVNVPDDDATETSNDPADVGDHGDSADPTSPTSGGADGSVPVVTPATAGDGQNEADDPSADPTDDHGQDPATEPEVGDDQSGDHQGTDQPGTAPTTEPSHDGSGNDGGEPATDSGDHSGSDESGGSGSGGSGSGSLHD